MYQGWVKILFITLVHSKRVSVCNMQFVTQCMLHSAIHLMTDFHEDEAKKSWFFVKKNPKWPIQSPSILNIYLQKFHRLVLGLVGPAQNTVKQCRKGN